MESPKRLPATRGKKTQSGDPCSLDADVLGLTASVSLFSGGMVSEYGRRENPSGPSSMTTTVLDHASTPEGVGVAFREPTVGPETELVDWFLARSLVRPPRGCRVTVFREPRIESGFPDLVAVVWSETVTRRWLEPRSTLTAVHVRVMHYLHWAREAKESDLGQLFGSRTGELLARLHAAGMVRKVGERWKARAIDSIFAVREIIAIEAKISNTTGVLDQAFLNTWFASSSFVLMPTAPKSTKFLQVATARGLGVWTRGGILHHPKPEEAVLPRSYASWLFNEWVWRAAMRR